jgi:DNA-binding MarR family transcriptional regulator
MIREIGMQVAEFKDILWGYTRRITENSNKVFNFIAEKYGFTILQVRILMELHQNGSHTIGGLAEDIYVAGTNISAMCKKLENMGYLKRVRDQEDERVVQVGLSQKGKEVVLEIDRELQERINQLIADEPEQNLADIISGMQKLDELLHKISKIRR